MVARPLHWLGAMDGTAPPTQSPSVRNCCLDDDDTCLGCFRSLEEIKEWSVVDHLCRRAILTNAQARKKAYDSSRGIFRTRSYEP